MGNSSSQQYRQYKESLRMMEHEHENENRNGYDVGSEGSENGAGIGNLNNITNTDDLSVLESLNINPYDVLGVSQNYTWDELKSAFRKTSKKVHPDRGGNSTLFNIVTICFKSLAKELTKRESDKPHHELKKEAKTFYEDETRYNPNVNGYGYHKAPDGMDRINNDKFNKMFQENRLVDEEFDFGYGDIMAKSSKVREDINIPKIIDKFNENKFHETFDKITLPESSDVVVYKEPEPQMLSKKLIFTEIGVTNTSDYSKNEAERKGGLIYTDFKKAHTTVRLIDPRSVQARPEYKSVEQFEKALAQNTARPLTKEELAQQKLKEENDKLREIERLKRVNQRDKQIKLQYERSMQKMIGGR